MPCVLPSADVPIRPTQAFALHESTSVFVPFVRLKLQMPLLHDVDCDGEDPMDDVEALKQLKARYFRYLDTKDWPRYRQLFTEDVVIDVSGSGGEVFRGIDAYMDYIQKYVVQLKTVHHGHMPEITLTSETAATGVWSMEDRVAFPDGREMNGQGHYFEKYVKAGGEWRIQEMALTRLRIHSAGRSDWFTSSAVRSLAFGTT